MIWEEENGEINELHVLQTDFDFVQANHAVQKTLNLMSDTDTNASTRGGAPSTAAGGFDDWDDQPSQSSKANARSSAAPTDTASQASRTTGADVSGLDNNYQVTSVAWSCNGSNLAVAHGKTDHVTWCEH